MELFNWGAFWLKPGSFPNETVPVGAIHALDEHGVTITLIDWATLGPHGHDLFIAWEAIITVLIRTTDDDFGQWVEQAKNWQNWRKTPKA